MNKRPSDTGVEFYDTQSPDRVMQMGRGKYRSLYQWQRVKQTLDLIDPLDLRGKVVLEIGPGEGTWTLEFLRRGAKVAIVDVRASMVEAVRRLVKMYGFDGIGLRAAVGSFPDVKPPVDECDLLFAKDVIEHILDEKAMWESIGRLVRPGGYLVLSTQNSRSINYVLQAPYARFVKRQHVWFGWDTTHVRFYTSSRLRDALTEQGFEDVRFAGAHHVPFVFGPLKYLAKLGPHPDICAAGADAFLLAAQERFGLRHKLLAAGELTGLSTSFPFSCLGWSIAVRARKTAQ